MNPLDIALVQSDIVWENKEENFKRLNHLIENNISDNSKIIIFPEMFATGFSMQPDIIAETMNGATMEWMRTKSRSLRKIICGSIAIKEENHYYNRLIWMQPDGNYYYYDKAHLFAKAGEDKYYSKGDQRLIVSVNGWKFLVIVCYDLRFPVWIRQSKNIYDGIICIANWPEMRSKAWNALLQARAIENQCFVLGVNRIGNDGKDIYHCGDTQIVSPDGSILSQISHNEMIINYELDYSDLEKTREDLPFLEDRDSFIIT